MAREGYAASGNAVYKVNQRTGEVTYEGEYGGRGGQSIRNSIQTVGARQAARTASAYRNSTSSARESAVPAINRSSSVEKIKLPKAGKDNTYNINGTDVIVSHGGGSSFPHVQPSVTVGIRQSDGSFKNRSFKYGWNYRRGYGNNATYTKVENAFNKAKAYIRKQTS